MPIIVSNRNLKIGEIVTVSKGAPFFDRDGQRRGGFNFMVMRVATEEEYMAQAETPYEKRRAQAQLDKKKRIGGIFYEISID